MKEEQKLSKSLLKDVNELVRKIIDDEKIDKKYTERKYYTFDEVRLFVLRAYNVDRKNGL